jgi:hypothetical protein
MVWFGFTPELHTNNGETNALATDPFGRMNIFLYLLFATVITFYDKQCDAQMGTRELYVWVTKISL